YRLVGVNEAVAHPDFERTASRSLELREPIRRDVGILVVTADPRRIRRFLIVVSLTAHRFRPESSMRRGSLQQGELLARADRIKQLRPTRRRNRLTTSTPFATNAAIDGIIFPFPHEN